MADPLSRSLTRRRLLQQAAMAGAMTMVGGCGPAISRSLRSATLQTGSKPKITPPKPLYPIDHVFFIVQENRTFDNMFMNFPAGSETWLPDCPPDLRFDPSHAHLPYELGPTLGMKCTYRESYIPDYWKYARYYTMGDSFFSEIAGSSLPNHFMMMAAQAPIVDFPNRPWACPRLCYNVRILPDNLVQVGLTWKDYTDANWNVLDMVKGYLNTPANVPTKQFVVDCQNDNLPNVAWLKASPTKSDHPPASLQDGEKWVKEIVNALSKSKAWSRSVIFLYWDDWGGFYDHVEPPHVETWADGSPMRYGTRAGFIVISPYAKPSFITHDFHSFTSLLKFVETNWNLPPLTTRDRDASNLLDCFDFTQKPRAPLILP